jgi:hypothetical protein
MHPTVSWPRGGARKGLRPTYILRRLALGTPKARLAHLHKHKATWLKSGLVATVRHLRGEQKLRHATLTAVRAEK